jgi:small subunit ribosomal protein S6
MAVDYEIAILLSSQLPEGQAEEAINRYQKVMTDGGAEVVKVDRWGVRKLAYEIRKQQQADYSFIQFTGEPAVVDELDRLCRLDEGVLRHMIIRPEGGFEPEPEPEPEAEAVETAETTETAEATEDAEAEGADEESGDDSEGESEADDAETEEGSE